MTYRNKLLLKRLLMALGIAVGIILLLLLIGFIYLGRYVVYTEKGAYFSFHAPETSPTEQAAFGMPESIELVTGEPIAAAEVIGETASDLSAQEVRGYFLDYRTLKDGSTLDKLELSRDDVNTLMLEMRIEGEDLLDTTAVQRLITRAEAQDLRLIAVVSCLSDSSYALAHQELALRIDGGALWMSSAGTYWLDPGNDAVIRYVTDMVKKLAAMGFHEVVLNDFSMPVSDSLVYDFGEKNAEDITLLAYRQVEEAVVDQCRIGLLVGNPAEGHLAFDAADHIYVCNAVGNSVESYVERHPDRYLVFITDSHDTRFDGFGKLEVQGNPVTSVSTGALVEEASEEQYAQEDSAGDGGDYEDYEDYEDSGGYEDYEDYGEDYTGWD